MVSCLSCGSALDFSCSNSNSEFDGRQGVSGKKKLSVRGFLLMLGQVRKICECGEDFVLHQMKGDENAKC